MKQQTLSFILAMFCIFGAHCAVQSLIVAL